MHWRNSKTSEYKIVPFNVIKWSVLTSVEDRQNLRPYIICDSQPQVGIKHYYPVNNLFTWNGKRKEKKKVNTEF